jgi:hypothetical protein
MWEALLFIGATAAQQAADAFLQVHTDLLALRARRLVDMLSRPDSPEWMDTGITCVDCGTQNLELWYTGQRWGETVCLPCYETRVARGQARPQEL